MNSRLISAALVIGIATVTSGCERPFDRTPPGFAEACYGGREEAAKNWVCADDRLVLSVEGGEADWPTLAKMVSEFGRGRGLAVFDTSSSIPDYVRTLEISICSSEGLFLLMDKRVYADRSMNRDGNRITAHLRTYDANFNWKPLAEDLVETFRRNWRGPVQVEWPEFIPASEKKALPDSVKSCNEDARPFLETKLETRIVLDHVYFPTSRAATSSRGDLATWLGKRLERMFPKRFRYRRLDLDSGSDTRRGYEELLSTLQSLNRSRTSRSARSRAKTRAPG
jgi:hypothetical protein